MRIDGVREADDHTKCMLLVREGTKDECNICIQGMAAKVFSPAFVPCQRDLAHRDPAPWSSTPSGRQALCDH